MDKLFIKNKEEQIIRYTSRDNKRESIYNYNTSGELKNFTQNIYKKDGSLNSSLEEFYNSQGNLVEYRKFHHWKACNYSSDAQTESIHKKFEYYQNGFLSKIYYLNENESLERTIEYKIVYKE